LEFFMRDELMDGMFMFPYPDEENNAETFFTAPPTSSSFDKVLEHIDQGIPADTPLAFGLHPNAEIGFRTDTSEKLFRTIQELSPQEQASGEGAESPQFVTEALLGDILDMFRDARFELESIKNSVEEMGPFQNVFLMECERMNVLLTEIVRSLLELDLGFKGDLTMSEAMEVLQDCLFMERVPPSWEKLAYPTMRSLPLWLTNLQQRHAQLSNWVGNTAEIPMVTWLSGLFNPQSFLTAIMQVGEEEEEEEDDDDDDDEDDEDDDDDDDDDHGHHAGDGAAAEEGAGQADHLDRGDQEGRRGGHHGALPRRCLRVRSKPGGGAVESPAGTFFPMTTIHVNRRSVIMIIITTIIIDDCERRPNLRRTERRRPFLSWSGHDGEEQPPRDVLPHAHHQLQGHRSGPPGPEYLQLPGVQDPAARADLCLYCQPQDQGPGG
jgi:hypothetical protein